MINSFTLCSLRSRSKEEPGYVKDVLGRMLVDDKGESRREVL
jgi:hypothetical protein